MLKITTAIAVISITIALGQEQIPQHVLRTAEENQPAVMMSLEPYFGVGFQVGFLSGVGFSFRYTSPQRYALEANAGYITVSEKRSWYSFGAEAQYQFDKSLESRFYGLIGVGYYADDKETGNALSFPTRIGVGFGYEIFISRTIAVAGELPLTLFLGKSGSQVLPTLQLGLIYYFR